MKVAILAIVLLLAAGVTACGDDDGGEPAIRSEGGLGVALVAANAQFGADRSASGESDDGGTDAAPGAAIPGESSSDGSDEALMPLAQSAGDGLTVTGYGVATAPADLAVIEFYFSGYSVRPVEPDSGGGGSGSEGADDPATSTSPSTFTTAIGEADLQPVIDAIVALGVSRDDIEVLSGSYYDYYGGTATLRVRLSDVGKLGDVVDAAVNASAGLADISLSSTNVSFMVEDCAPVEQAALEAAADDAATRGTALAAALGVGRGSITGASSYSYSPYGGSSCDVGYIGPYPLGGVAYAEGQARDVQVYANITVTYAVE